MIAAAARGRPDRGKVGRPSFWQDVPGTDLVDWPEGGGYPVRAFPAMLADLAAGDADVLHVCSGGVQASLTVDCRSSVAPRIVADAHALPFRDRSIAAVMIDPPYSTSYAQSMYGGGRLSITAIMHEARRVLEPGGRVGIFHPIEPTTPRPGLELVTWRAYRFGAKYAIRGWWVYARTEVAEAIL